MSESRPDSMHGPGARSQGRTPLLVALVLGLTIAGVLCFVYKPWNVLMYGRAEAPLPTSTDLEVPLAQRIKERVERVRTHPYDAEAWGKLGETYDVHDSFPQAIFCYERAQRLAPKESRWPYLLGIVQRIGDQKAALACFERAIALAPDMAAAHFYAGHSYLQSERYDDAKREFARALELEKDAPAALIGLAKIALSKNDPKAALEFLDRAAKQPLATKEASWLTAAAWRAQGDETKAAQFAGPGEVQPKQESFPDRLRSDQVRSEGVTLRFARMRADEYLAHKEPDQAVAEITRYLDQVPTSAGALVALGDVYMQQGKPEEAIPRYQAALSVDPTQAGALANWGHALDLTGKPEEAILKVRAALALEASRIEFKSMLAGMLANSSKKEELAESLALMREVNAARPEDATSWMNLAQALGANGLGDEAIAAFQHALKLVPPNASVQHSYGVLCARVGHLAEAAEAFAAVVKADPTRTGARANLIHALTELGHHREAIAAIHAALEEAPKSVQLRAQLAWMLSTSPDDGARDGKKALALARELVEGTTEKNPEFLVIRGAAEAETGDIPAGTKSVDAALELMKPQPGETVQDLGLIGIIDQALGCRKAFKEGKPFRTGTP